MKVLVKSLMVALAPVLAACAWAAQPWVSVPSTPTADQRMVINGGGMAPGAPVVLRIQHPSGAVSTHALAADASGTLRFEYALGATGSYAVEATDAGGKVIGAGRLGHFR